MWDALRFFYVQGVYGFYKNTVLLPAAVAAFNAFGLSIVLLIMSFHDLST